MPKISELTEEQRSLMRLQSRAYNQALSTLRENHRDEFDQIYQEQYEMLKNRQFIYGDATEVERCVPKRRTRVFKLDAYGICYRCREQNHSKCKSKKECQCACAAGVLKYRSRGTEKWVVDVRDGRRINPVRSREREGRFVRVTGEARH